MARVFNIREGFTADNDTLPEVFFTNFTEGPLKGTGAIEKEDFEEAKKIRYEIMGWDKEGKPGRAKLIELDLDWLVERLY